MAVVAGCKFPEELYYNVEKHTWARPEGDGTVTVGITDTAQSLAGKIIVVTPKPPGKSVEKGKSVGTVESGKWVGPVASPLSGEIVAVNEAAKKTPALLNSDPYGEGWVVRIKPANWEADRADLVTGEAGIEAYRQRLERDGLTCSATA